MGYEFSEYEKKWLYYPMMWIICIVFLILLTKHWISPMGKTIELATDWPEDTMYVMITFQDQDFTPTFIAPDNTQVEAIGMVSSPYATYKLDTSQYHKGTWQLLYPDKIKRFSYSVAATKG